MVGHTRRNVLESAWKAGAVGTVGVLAGCSQAGGILAGGPNLEVTNVENQVTNWGDVELTVTVTNDGGEAGTGTLYGQVDVEGGDVYTESQEITVPADKTNEYTLYFSIQFSDSLGASGYEHDAWIETEEGGE